MTLNVLQKGAKLGSERICDLDAWGHVLHLGEEQRRKKSGGGGEYNWSRDDGPGTTRLFLYRALYRMEAWYILPGTTYLLRTTMKY